MYTISILERVDKAYPLEKPPIDQINICLILLYKFSDILSRPSKEFALFSPPYGSTHVRYDHITYLISGEHFFTMDWKEN